MDAKPLDLKQRIAALERMLARYERESQVAEAAMNEADENVLALRQALEDARKLQNPAAI